MIFLNINLFLTSLYYNIIIVIAIFGQVIQNIDYYFTIEIENIRHFKLLFIIYVFLKFN